MRVISIYLQYFFGKLLILLGLVVLVVAAYLCKTNHFSFGLLNLICGIFSNDNKEDWMYQIEYVIFVFVFICIVTIILISIYKTHKTKRGIIRKKYVGLFVKSIFYYLYAETTTDQQENREFLYKLWRNLQNEYAKRLYINLLRQIYLETKGDVHLRLALLIEGLKYDTFIKSYLLSPFLKNNLFALKTIRDLKISGYEKYIIRIINKRGVKMTRSAALTTLIQFDGYDDLRFLTESRIELSTWEINYIVKALPASNQDKIDYEALIMSDVPSVAMLGLIFANLNEKNEFKAIVKSKIDIDKSTGIVSDEAVFAFSLFSDCSADYEYLISIFDCCSPGAQIRILKELSKCPNKDLAIYFLDWIVEKFSYKFKLVAMKSLLELNLLTVFRYVNSNELLTRQACHQVLDFNL
jgi:hypothetical protein